jgi:ribulose-phosphate 3-epimerase
MTGDPFATTAPLIAASILSADFAKLDREMAEVDRGGADFWHLDVMDGHFVPNISFGPHYVASIRPLTKAFFDAHLMISEPLRYAPAFIKAGVDAITFHVEVASDVAATARELRKLGCKARRRHHEPATPVESDLPRAR